MGEPVEIPLLRIDPEGPRRQVERTRRVRATRDAAAVTRSLGELREAARGVGAHGTEASGSGDNLMPRILECVRAYATLGEIVQVLREEFGEYREAALF